METISYPADAHHQTLHIENSSFWYLHRNTVIINSIKKHIPHNSTIYDLGGGNGNVTKAITNAGYNCVLVEALPDAVANATLRNVEHIIQSTIQDFTQPQLDAVMLLDVAEHIENDIALFEQLFNQLSKGGVAIITVPAFEHLTTNIDTEIGHFRRYSASGIIKKLKTVGFEIKSNSYFFSLLYFPFLLFRVLKYKLGLYKPFDESRRKEEHLSGKHWLNKLMIKLLSLESRLIRSGLRIPLGTSCLIVVNKP